MTAILTLPTPDVLLRKGLDHPHAPTAMALILALLALTYRHRFVRDPAGRIITDRWEVVLTFAGFRWTLDTNFARCPTIQRWCAIVPTAIGSACALFNTPYNDRFYGPQS